MKFDYYAFVIGGEGPDVWDKELQIDAADINDALNQAQGYADETGGWVCTVEQTDHPESTKDGQIKQLEQRLAIAERRAEDAVAESNRRDQKWKDGIDAVMGKIDWDANISDSHARTMDKVWKDMQQRLAQSEAAAAQMRDTFKNIWLAPDGTIIACPSSALINAALSTDSGRGWTSPKDTAKLKGEAAALRRGLEIILSSASPNPTANPSMSRAWNAGKEALSTSAGKDLLEESAKLKASAIEQQEFLRKALDELSKYTPPLVPIFTHAPDAALSLPEETTEDAK